MKIHKAIFFLLGISLATLSFSQGIETNYEAEEVQEIINGTIYIIPTGDKVFDDSLKVAVEKYWKVSAFKILRSEEVDLYLKDENNHFLASVNILGNDGYGSNSKVVSPLSGNSDKLYIFHGSKKSKIKNLQYQAAISRQLLFHSKEAEYYSKENAAIGLGYVVKNLNDNVDFINSKKLTGKNKPSEDWAKKVSLELSNRSGVLKNKILLIDSKDMEKPFLLREKPMSKYKYQYKVVKTSELISLIYSDPRKYCFLGKTNSLFSIFDAETRDLVYSIDPTTFSGISLVTEKHIEALNSSVANNSK